MNLVQIQEHLKGMPIQALMAYANGMNPVVPPYLALGELNRRKQVEQSAQKPEAPQGTVKDKIEGEAGLMALKKQAMDQMRLGALRQQQMAQGQAAQTAMTPQAVPAGAPEPQMQEEVEMADGGIATINVPDFATSYGSGGIVAFADEGLVRGENNEPMTATERKRKAQEAAKDFLMRQYEESKAKQDAQPKERSGVGLPDVAMPEQPDFVTIPGFEAGTVFSDAMRRAQNRPAQPTPQQIEANVARPSMADQIPGQKYTAPAPTGIMPGEFERNVMNTMSALPGASVMRAAPTGIRALAPYISALTGVQEPTSEVERGRPTMANDPRLISPQNVEPEVERGRPTMANDPRLVGIAAAAANQMERQRGNAGRATSLNRTDVSQSAQPAQVAQPAQPAGLNFLQMLADQATGKGQNTYEQAMAAAAQKDPYLNKQPGEIMDQYIKRMEQRQAGEEARQKELEQDRTRSALWRSLIAAGEASRGTRGIGALMAGFGKTAGEELEAGRVREESQMKARREFEDNVAKMRQEIENARIARSQGRFKDALEYDRKAQQSKDKAIEKGAEIQGQKDLAAIRFEYEKKLKGIPQAQRLSLEEQYVEEAVKAGKPRADAIREAKTLGIGAERQDLAELKALQTNITKQLENYNISKETKASLERQLAEVNNRIATMVPGLGGGPKEGDKSTSNSGKPIIYRNGRWEYV